MPRIPLLCLTGELRKTKVSDFAQAFSKFPGLTHLAITDTQNLDHFQLHRRYVDDRLMDAQDERRENSPFNENHMLAARKFLSLCPTLKAVRLLHFLDGSDGEVEDLWMRQQPDHTVDGEASAEEAGTLTVDSDPVHTSNANEQFLRVKSEGRAKCAGIDRRFSANHWEYMENKFRHY